MLMGRKDTHLERVVVCQYPLIGKKGCFIDLNTMARIDYLVLILTKLSSRAGFSRGPSQLYDAGGSF